MEQIITSNRKAAFNYDIISTYECGIVLFGNEVISLKNNQCSISEAFCYIKNGECFITNSYIKLSGNVMFNNIEETRDRKLLLHKKEINKLYNSITKEGYTLVPLKIIKVKHLYKVIIALAKGKKLYNKKQDLKEKDIKRDTERYIMNKRDLN